MEQNDSDCKRIKMGGFGEDNLNSKTEAEADSRKQVHRNRITSTYEQEGATLPIAIV